MRSISSSVILSAVRSYSFVVFGDAWPAIRFIAVNVRPSSLLRKAYSAEFLPEAAGRARVSGRDAAFAGWQ